MEHMWGLGEVLKGQIWAESPSIKLASSLPRLLLAHKALACDSRSVWS